MKLLPILIVLALLSGCASTGTQTVIDLSNTLIGKPEEIRAHVPTICRDAPCSWGYLNGLGLGFIGQFEYLAADIEKACLKSGAKQEEIDLAYDECRLVGLYQKAGFGIAKAGVKEILIKFGGSTMLGGFGF